MTLSESDEIKKKADEIYVYSMRLIDICKNEYEELTKESKEQTTYIKEQNDKINRINEILK